MKHNHEHFRIAEMRQIGPLNEINNILSNPWTPESYKHFFAIMKDIYQIGDRYKSTLESHSKNAKMNYQFLDNEICR
jgi:hypothetical protein